MKPVIAEIHDFKGNSLCLWCGGKSKKECVTVSFKAGLLDESVLCIKCLRNALRVQGTPKQATSSKPVESAS